MKKKIDFNFEACFFKVLKCTEIKHSRIYIDPVKGSKSIKKITIRDTNNRKLKIMIKDEELLNNSTMIVIMLNLQHQRLIKSLSNR